MPKNLAADSHNHRAVAIDEFLESRIFRRVASIYESTQKLGVAQACERPRCPEDFELSLDRSLLDLNHGRCTSNSLDRSFYLINAATGSRHTEFSKKWNQCLSQRPFKTLGARLRGGIRRLECLIS